MTEIERNLAAIAARAERVLATFAGGLATSAVSKGTS